MEVCYEGNYTFTNLAYTLDDQLEQFQRQFCCINGTNILFHINFTSE